MKITKRQLKRIIKEERARLLREVTPANAQFSPGDSTLEITQDKYDSFAEEIANGPYGQIDNDDVARQWEGMFSVHSLSDVALQYLIANLDANGLIGGQGAGEY
jgi:hypothetical protein